MDRIAELFAKGLENLSVDELTELDGLISAEADRLADEDVTPDVVTTLGELADQREQVTAEIDKRDAAQAELDEQRQAALDRLRPVDDTTDAGDGDGDEDEDGEDVEGDDGADSTSGQPEAVAAGGAPAGQSTSARRPSLRDTARTVPARRRATARQTAGDEPTSRTTITASGNTVSTRREIAEAVSRAVEDSRGIANLKRPVVHAAIDYPADRRLGTDARRNSALVAAALEDPQALVAAGGLCAPIENLYDVRVVGVAERPVRDALAPFQADRGGVSLRPSPIFQDWGDGAGVWTLQNDIDSATAGGADPTKSIVEADCIGFEDFFVDGVYQRVGFRNVTARFDPEGTQANLEVLDIAHARFAENRLLAKIASLSLAVTSPRVVGATRDILATIDRSVAYYRNRHRLADTTPMRYIAPRWVKDMIRADLTRGATDLDQLAVADAQIAEWFARRYIRPTWHLDGRPTAQVAAVGPPVVVGIAAQQYAAAISGSPVPEFIDTVEQLLFAEGDFLFLDGGTLDLGVVRDSTLNASNRYELFKESFEGVGFRGVEALQVVSTVDPNGLRAGTIDTSAISD